MTVEFVADFGEDSEFTLDRVRVATEIAKVFSVSEYVETKSRSQNNHPSLRNEFDSGSSLKGRSILSKTPRSATEVTREKFVTVVSTSLDLPIAEPTKNPNEYDALEEPNSNKHGPNSEKTQTDLSEKAVAKKSEHEPAKSNDAAQITPPVPPPLQLFKESSLQNLPDIDINRNKFEINSTKESAQNEVKPETNKATKEKKGMLKSLFQKLTEKKSTTNKEKKKMHRSMPSLETDSKKPIIVEPFVIRDAAEEIEREAPKEVEIISRRSNSSMQITQVLAEKSALNDGKYDQFSFEMISNTFESTPFNVEDQASLPDIDLKKMKPANFKSEENSDLVEHRKASNVTHYSLERTHVLPDIDINQRAPNPKELTDEAAKRKLSNEAPSHYSLERSHVLPDIDLNRKNSPPENVVSSKKYSLPDIDLNKTNPVQVQPLVSPESRKPSTTPTHYSLEQSHALPDINLDKTNPVLVTSQSSSETIPAYGFNLGKKVSLPDIDLNNMNSEVAKIQVPPMMENMTLPDIDIRKASTFERTSLNQPSLSGINHKMDLPELDLNKMSPVYINGQYCELRQSLSIRANENNTSLPDIDILKNSMFQDSAKVFLPNIDINQSEKNAEASRPSETELINDERTALKMMWKLVDGSDLPDIDIMKCSFNAEVELANEEHPKSGLLKFQRKASKVEYKTSSSSLLKALRERLANGKCVRSSKNSYSMNDLNTSSNHDVVNEATQTEGCRQCGNTETENFTLKAKEALISYKKSKK